MADKTILIVGTYDTKNDELDYMAERIGALGGGVPDYGCQRSRRPCGACGLFQA